MKILLVNNFYYNRGGDCTYMFALKDALESRGHEVVQFAMHHPKNFDSEYSEYFVSYINYVEEVARKNISSGLKVLNRAVYSSESRQKIEELILAEKPDVAHLQNIHHHITPSIFYALKKHGIPIVWTLHDYTLICPNTSFISNGKICEKCKKRKYYWPFLSRCKKNSVAASAMAAMETISHRLLGVNDLVDMFLTPSEFLRQKLIEYGFDVDRIKCLNNFTSVGAIAESTGNSNYYLYVGRLAEEKGIRTLIDAAILSKSGRLKILGDGELKQEMEDYVDAENGREWVEFLGHISHEEVINLIENCSFVVLPSEWYENFPYALLEAFACGKTVVASRIGGIPEIVKNWDTGLLYKPGDVENLALKIRFLVNHPEKAQEMGRKAREIVKENLSPDRHCEMLMEIYETVIAKSAKVNK